MTKPFCYLYGCSQCNKVFLLHIIMNMDIVTKPFYYQYERCKWNKPFNYLYERGQCDKAFLLPIWLFITYLNVFNVAKHFYFILIYLDSLTNSGEKIRKTECINYKVFYFKIHVYTVTVFVKEKHTNKNYFRNEKLHIIMKHKVLLFFLVMKVFVLLPHIFWTNIFSL